MAADFANFLRDNKDQLTALTIYYDQPQRRRELTLASISEVLECISAKAPKLAPLRVWEAYARLDELSDDAQPISELTALVALIRRVCGIDEKWCFADLSGVQKRCGSGLGSSVPGFRPPAIQ